MRIGDYEELLESASRFGEPLMCLYCGAETLTLAGTGACMVCEARLIYKRRQIAGLYGELRNSLEEINSAILKSDYDTVLKEYAQILLRHKEPGFLYANALANVKFSNYKLSQIRYDREGFMEENIVLRNDAAKLIADAKLLLIKALDSMDLENQSADQLYLRFLCHVKLGSNRAASASVLSQLKAAGNQMLAAYATLVFEAELGNYDAVIRTAESLMGKDRLWINALFYVAYAMFKKQRIEESRSLAKLLMTYGFTQKTDYLLSDIAEYEAIWK